LHFKANRQFSGVAHLARRTFNATDLGINLDRIADNRAPSQWIYLEGIETWQRLKADRYRAGVDRCQVCGRYKTSKPVRPASRYCLACDSAGLDGVARYPGLDVDSAPNVDYDGATPTTYSPDPTLSGGKG
jgi:hypothetical protein